MNPYLLLILIIITGHFILDVTVSRLRLKNLSPELPEEFKDAYDAERYRTSQEYTRESTRFGMIKSIISTPLTIAFILFGGFNYVDLAARSFGFGEIITGLIFMGILGGISYILSLPFSIYGTFVIEEKYGFNRTTVKTFIMDMIKGIILSVLIGGAVLALVLWFFQELGSYAWLVAWGGVTLISLVMQFIAPVLIMPLFNKFTPLEDGELKESIETYAAKQDFALRGIFTMDGSKRSTKGNAYFTGFGKFRRIVFFDTLIEQMHTKEILAVLAHEMGHFRKGHIWRGMLLGMIISAGEFYLLSLFLNNELLFGAFGMTHLSVYASLVFFMFIFSPVDTLLSILSSALSRKHEYEADRYALETTGMGEELISGLKKLTVQNLGNLTPHPLEVTLSYSHPPILQRIEAMRAMED